MITAFSWQQLANCLFMKLIGFDPLGTLCSEDMSILLCCLGSCLFNGPQHFRYCFTSVFLFLRHCCHLYYFEGESD